MPAQGTWEAIQVRRMGPGTDQRYGCYRSSGWWDLRVRNTDPASSHCVAQKKARGRISQVRMSLLVFTGWRKHVLSTKSDGSA